MGGGLNAEHGLGCVRVGSETEEAFFSKASTALSRLALQRHDSSLSTDAPFTPSWLSPPPSTLSVRFRALLLLLLPSGEAGRCTLLGLILGPEVELELGAGAGHLRLRLWPRRTRSFWGSGTLCV